MTGIVDYGLGNIGAIKNIYDELGVPVKLVSEVADFGDVDRLILPGVGSFDHAMSSLTTSGLRSVLNELVIDKKIPVLGICVGMQIMGLSSEEGILKGLNWVNGTNQKFILPQTNNVGYRIPHMGWNKVTVNKDSTLLKGLVHPRFYFLHSYHFSSNSIAKISTSTYINQFCCAFESDNVYGVQFHPEKSHFSGIKVLKNFSEI